MKQKYKGIHRTTTPDWLGWLILDLLKQRPEETAEHKKEIKRQLKYEFNIYIKQHGTYQAQTT